MLKRRDFLVKTLGATAGLAAGGAFPRALRAADGAAANNLRPNIVIVLADDMGWRDTGYQGSPRAKTPNLDDMASKGVRFDYFYAAQQMCSPGRFAILTGRTPFRVGLHHLGSMRPEEITIARALKTAGYRTGHFGKWHLGKQKTHPIRMGFDRSLFSFNFFDMGGTLTIDDTKEAVPIQGDSSVFTMDRAIEWIRQGQAADEPFFAYVCFGSPHQPHQGTEEFRALYPDAGGKQDFLAELSGVDAAVGNLRTALREMGIADNTLVWFTSDNGGITPESKDPAGLGKTRIGARTVACMEWPARVRQPLHTDCACVHMDMYPTILDIAGVRMPNQPVLDGVSLVPLLEGRMQRRDKPMGFLSWDYPKQADLAAADFVRDTGAVWIDGPMKLVIPQPRDGRPGVPALFDIYADPAEKTDLAAGQPERVAQMRRDLERWQKSVRASYDGKDYAGGPP